MRQVLGKCLALCFVPAVLVAYAPRIAEASFQLKIDDLKTSGVDVTLTDIFTSSLVGPGTDQNPAPGVLVFSGGVGNFSVVLTMATSKPIGQSPDLVQLQMSAIVFAANPNLQGGPDILHFELTDTDFQLATQNPTAATTASLTSSVTALSPNPVVFDSYVNLTNVGFGQGPIAIHQVLTPPPAQFGELSSYLDFQFPDASPFSISQVVEVKHTASNQTTSFSIVSLVHAPEPASLVAWCLLGGLGTVLGYRRRKVAS